MDVHEGRFLWILLLFTVVADTAALTVNDRRSTCASTCRGYSCDEILKDYPLTCSFLEQNLGCDCSGCTCSPAPCALNGTALHRHQEAVLRILYRATNGLGWKTRTNWLNESVGLEYWHGVKCNGATGEIIQLWLEQNSLSGTIPPQLGSLTALQFLSLTSSPKLAGSIPPALGKLTALHGLSLMENTLSGSIPTQVGNLTALKTLELWSNQLTGSIPVTIANVLGLTMLGLGLNQISGMR